MTGAAEPGGDAMIDRKILRSTIEGAPPEGDVAIVSRKWLEQVEAELEAGDAAAAELAALRGPEAKGHE